VQTGTGRANTTAIMGVLQTADLSSCALSGRWTGNFPGRPSAGCSG
jgi:hypothetical protein